MKYPYSFFMIILLLGSCSGKDKVPSGILPEKEMQKVMWDMARADRFVSDFVTRDSSLDQKKEKIKLYEEIFLLHKITREKFQKSLLFYQSRPDMLKVVLDSLNAEARKAEQESFQPTPPVTRPVDTPANIRPVPPKKMIRRPDTKARVQ